jgi:hypothetical protein
LDLLAVREVHGGASFRRWTVQFFGRGGEEWPGQGDFSPLLSTAVP